MRICGATPRETVWVDVPDNVDAPESPVSVTVMLYAADGELCDDAGFELVVAASCVETLIARTTGGLFCGK